MLNGAGLSPSDYTTMFPEGLNIPQAVLILPAPEAPTSYLLFHGTYDDFVSQTASYLYLSKVDMSMDGGMGGVTTKEPCIDHRCAELGQDHRGETCQWPGLVGLLSQGEHEHLLSLARHTVRSFH